jgi:oxygen-independent coproporphyrinogen-3 oxidase
MLQPESPPPLSLYVHLPWCLRKCPYCDFNSHPVANDLPEDPYVQALLRDLEQELPRVWGRSVSSIYLGGGTPSLFSAAAVNRLLAGVRARLPVLPSAEITLEANPGTVDQERFAGYRQAGVNRLSLGVQSFNPEHLRSLGRIHGPDEAAAAVEAVRAAGFERFNLDLMFGLPGQTTAQALDDLTGAIQLAPEHISLYQLTIEPNTAFHHQPPGLPGDDRITEMQEQLLHTLAAHHYRRYEISAYARGAGASQHNLNYWRFGDYLGIGAGAHGKLTDHSGVYRSWKIKHPKSYLTHAGSPAALGGRQRLNPGDLVLEFMMNALRLTDGVPRELFARRTGLPDSTIQAALRQAIERGWLYDHPRQLRCTPRGLLFLNDVLALFVPDGPPEKAWP